MRHCFTRYNLKLFSFLLTFATSRRYTMQLRNNSALKLFALLLVLTEFLAPSFLSLPEKPEEGSSNNTYVQAQKHSNYLFSYFEESRNNEEERGSQNYCAIPIMDYTLAWQIATLNPETHLSSEVSVQELFEVRPPLYELH